MLVGVVAVFGSPCPDIFLVFGFSERFEDGDHLVGLDRVAAMGADDDLAADFDHRRSPSFDGVRQVVEGAVLVEPYQQITDAFGELAVRGMLGEVDERGLAWSCSICRAWSTVM